MNGTLAEIAPMTRPGVVLSQPPISTTPSNGCAADHLLGLHRQHVAVEHGGRLGEALVDRERGQLDGEAAGLEDAALHVLRPLAEVRVARVDLGPGVEHADDRLAHEVLLGEAELHHPRAVAEAAEVVGREPAGAAQLVYGALLARVVEHHCSSPARCRTAYAASTLGDGFQAAAWARRRAFWTSGSGSRPAASRRRV